MKDDDEADVDRSDASESEGIVEMLLVDEKTENGEAEENVHLQRRRRGMRMRKRKMLTFESKNKMLGESGESRIRRSRGKC